MAEFKALGQKLLGQWTGECRLWLDPTKDPLVSEIKTEFSSVMNDLFFRQRYRGTVNGKPHEGEELIAFNSVRKTMEIAWVDSFHMNYAIMLSTGELTENGWDVLGNYDVAPSTPQWSWRTRLQLQDDKHLQIDIFNLSPEGQEDPAIAISYHRE